VAVAIALAMVTAAAPEPARAVNSRGCRAAVARSVVRMTNTALVTVARCHRQNYAGDVQAACSALPEQGASNWGRQANRTGLYVSARCSLEDTAVRQNYPPCSGDGCDNIASVVIPESEALLETSAGSVLTETIRDGRAGRCQRAIAKVQRRVALHVLDRSQRCQFRIDARKGQTEFGPIRDDCLAAAGAAGRSGADRIRRACRGFAPSDVGSCAPLPECVVDASQTLGQDLARLTYGQPASCGDGALDAFEECDDGNAVSTDACTDACLDAVCGDGITWTGVEECDDGNADPTDGCDACRLPVCGDGVRAGGEECDDGNAIAGDGCTACTIDSVLCGAGGLRATVAYDDPARTGAAAGRMVLAYPPAVSLPGSGAATSVRQRVLNASGTANPVFLPSDTDTDRDGSDDTIFLVFGLPGPWPSGPFATITFDCTAGTPVRAPDIACSFDDASDPFATAVDPAALVCAVTVLEPIP
jgi:cysteine-rich repeat protein